MADISKDEIRKEITAILKDANLTTMTAKNVRQQIEKKLEVDLSERKSEVDALVMEHLQEKQDGAKKKKKKKAASDESEDGEDDEEEASDEDEEEEEEKKPAKRGPSKKAVKRKKGSSDDDESGSDDDASDEEYSPKKVAKVTPKKGKPGKKGKGKKGSDSDSDEDWGKSKKTTSAKKAGGGGAAKGKGGSGYTRAITLTPELAAIVGANAMARHEVVKKVWEIIKQRNLYDPKNKQFAICDDELMKVIGVKRFRTFGMMKYLKNHFVD